MNVSVIIPTYNGAHKILHVLHSLEQQSTMPDEVLVVIDGSTDGTAALLREQQFLFPSFRVIEQENGGRARVRNRGALEASGDLLVFFDDDMRPQPQCVATHIAHHININASILTGGLMEEVVSESTDIQKFKAHLSQLWCAPLLKYDRDPMPASMTFLTAANCSIHKVTWERLNGMDPRLTDAEDYDMAVRAVKMGIRLYYNHKAFAWHDDFITCAGYIKRMRQYAAAQSKLQLLKPELYTASHQYAIHKPEGYKAVFFKFFCHAVWIKTIDRERWKLLPVKLRYKLYDWVITANGSFYPERVTL